MRILVLSADYPKFLRELYLARPGLAERSYAEQMAARNDSLFGVVDFYSRNFRGHGHEAAEIHINNPWLQYAWVRENRIKLPPLVPPPMADSPPPLEHPPSRALTALKWALRPAKPLLMPFIWRAQRLANRINPAMPIAAPDRTQWEHAVLKAQIEKFQPDLILNQELAYLRADFFGDVKKPGRLIFGQIASSMPDDDFGNYDMMISSLPNQVEWFRKLGAPAELNRLAFDPSVLEKLGPQPKRDIALSFCGSLSPDHASRIVFLEYLATRTPLKVWGNGIERLPASSPLHACYQGEAWGRTMYEIMRGSKITLNFHIDLAEDWANNLRLYEATGMSTLLLTDAKRNLHEMFVPGEHVVTYADAADCVQKIQALLADDATRTRIAAAGHAQVMARHNYYLRTGEILALAEKLA